MRKNTFFSITRECSAKRLRFCIKIYPKILYFCIFLRRFLSENPNMRKTVLFMMFVLTLLQMAWAQRPERLQSGDLLFLTKNRSDMENAITVSTGEYTHVALVERDSADDVWIIEASPKRGVQRISYSQFKREQLFVPFTGFFNIYRLTIPFDTAAVISRAKSLVGKPYDDAFLPDNDAYYCSELVQVVFGDLFESKPMNWRDADGNLPEYWVKHFEELNMPVPEGILGTNPTDMSQSPLLKKL